MYSVKMTAKVESTHEILPRKLIVYRRSRSGSWQCRFKVDGIWQRASTKEADLAKAKDAAHRLLIAAEVRKEQNLPVVTRRFRDVANLAIERMEHELKSGQGKVSFNDYIRVIREYLTPSLEQPEPYRHGWLICRAKPLMQQKPHGLSHAKLTGKIGNN
jgi:hypothetical protein